MMEKAFIFIDEFGNSATNLDKPGSFSHFVYTAVVLKESELEKAENVRKEISAKYFQNSPIKANRLSTAAKIDSLKKLISLNPIIYSLVIDKAKADGDGLKIRQIFYKYFQKIFISEITGHYEAYEVYVDKFGWPEFQISLKEYIEKNVIQRSLFAPDRYFHLADDKYEMPLLQLADISANGIGNIYCLSHQDDEYAQILESIKHYLIVDFFPGEIHYFLNNKAEESPEINRKIREISINSVVDYIDNPANDKYPSYKAILKYILMINQANPDQLVSSNDLIQIAQRYDPHFSQYQLRQAIAYFRDHEVLITSLIGKSGYKIPEKPEDLVNFFNRFVSNVVPMIKRLSIANTLIKKSTSNEIDIVKNHDEFGILQSLIEIVEKRKI